MTCIITNRDPPQTWSALAQFARCCIVFRVWCFLFTYSSYFSWQSEIMFSIKLRKIATRPALRSRVDAWGADSAPWGCAGGDFLFWGES